MLPSRPRVVIDTNVLFEGATKRDTAPGWIVDAWLAGLFQPCVSDSLVYEYVEVLSSKLSRQRWAKARPLLRELLARAHPVVVYYSWRPSSPDPGDEHVVDCAMNARALLVTSNVRDFRRAQARLGLSVLTPVEFLKKLRRESESRAQEGE